MRYKIYTKTEKAWDAIFQAIRNAKESIFFEMYIFVDDVNESHNFIELLKKKALEGIKVKVILDSFGSLSLSSQSINGLKEAGVELFFYRTLFRVTHRKLLIIDQKVAYLGGINIRKFFKKWNDLLIKLDGKIVKYALGSFARVYRDCGGKDVEILAYDKEMNDPRGKIWFLENFPTKNSYKLKKYYQDKLKLARHKILIVTPYLMPNRWVIRAFKKAVKRGVKIEIILPRFASNPKMANIPNYFYMHKLYKHGIKFFLTKEMTHSKLMIVDDEEGIIGSQNIDILSFDLNIESGIFFSESHIVTELTEIFEEWKKEAEPYAPQMRNTHLLDNFLDLCFNIFEEAIRFYNKLTHIFRF